MGSQFPVVTAGATLASLLACCRKAGAVRVIFAIMLLQF